MVITNEFLLRYLYGIVDMALCVSSAISFIPATKPTGTFASACTLKRKEFRNFCLNFCCGLVSGSVCVSGMLLRLC